MLPDPQVPDSLFGSLVSSLHQGERLIVVKAPPGSGKTFLLLQLAAEAARSGSSVAIAAQTNSQANDICRRIAREHAGTPTVRFAAADATASDLGPGVRWITASRELPRDPGIVVATVAKWGLVNLHSSFDVLFVDEAWQMSWADFMPLAQVSGRFVMIGDPGQIPPVVSVRVERWETSPRAPHMSTPDVILADDSIHPLQGSIDICRRLPHDAVDAVRGFYDFDFGAMARPGERFVKVNGTRHHDELDRALEMLGERSVAAVALPTDPEGPPFEVDPEVAGATADVVKRLLDRSAWVADGSDERSLEPGDIGVTSTHRVMNNEIRSALGRVGDLVRVDTPERWQGLERKVMVAVHPLSSVEAPTRFDLETGRLCVMASRHRAGLVLVSRDHVPGSLESFIPAAEQAVGRPDVVGRGHSDHLAFWDRIESAGQLFRLSA
jgi:hypothetical protein